MELLIVLAIMGVMMGLVGFSILGGGGNELGAAQRQLLGMVQKARTQAALSGLQTRLLINSDTDNQDRYHRYVEIVYRDANESESWVVAGEGKFLTDRVYLVPTSDDTGIFSEGWRSDAFSVWSNKLGEHIFLDDAFKGKRKEKDASNSFNFIEFDSAGNLVCQEDTNGILLPPKLVLAVGEPNPGSVDRLIRFNDPSAIAGILMRQFGGFAVLDVNDFELP
jgi:type II secretory pathway pseudopilin PulG